jgi:hypothetical protein
MYAGRYRRAILGQPPCLDKWLILNSNVSSLKLYFFEVQTSIIFGNSSDNVDIFLVL